MTRDQIDNIPFDFPEPSPGMKVERLALWATHYQVHQAEAVERGQPLLNRSGKALGPQLTDHDFCKASVEATVQVSGAVYNYDDFLADTAQVDCVRFYPHLPPKKAAELGRKRWRIARGPYGDGVLGLVLVPFRTIAVDPDHIPFGTVIYVPMARGKRITLPSGQTASHDGYFYAADAGGLIKQNHIDVFGGVSDANPFPEFIKDNSAGIFEAFRISDDTIESALAKAHQSKLAEGQMRGISTDQPCKDKANCVKRAGYEFVFRYYADPNLTGHPEKILKPDEAAALVAAGLQLGVCFQNGRSNEEAYFKREIGKRDGIYAYRYAQEMRQPPGSAIYFGMDVDPYPHQLPGKFAEHFEGIFEGFNSVSNNKPMYEIGIYGSGLVCATLKTKYQFIKFTWLAKPSGWQDREKYQVWDIKQFDGPGMLCGMKGGRLGDWELNETKTNRFGQFVPKSTPDQIGSE